MRVETKFVRLCEPVALGDNIGGWRVCWLGGWDKGHVFYLVMVARVQDEKPGSRQGGAVAAVVHKNIREGK
jgi:hypothetical protein